MLWMLSFTILTSAAKQRRVPEDKDEGQPESSSQRSGWSSLSLSVTNNVVNSRAGKRRRSVKDGDLSNHDTKRPKHSYSPRQSRSRLRQGKEDFIENWLSESYRSRRTSADNGSLPQEVSDNMPRKPTEVFPSPRDSEASTALISSRKSERSAASVHDTDYRQSLRYRNIYIERQDPSMELVRRATRIISRPRASPEIDDATIQTLRATSRRMQDEAEEDIVKQFAPRIIPAMDGVPDQRLEMHSDQLWSNSVPVLLKPSILTNPLPLPRPKPDLAFGYSETAFTENQLGAIDLLIDDQFGRSYAVPDQKLRFPFLDIEFKSQAKNGTHYVATNQVAGTGAIALNSYLELIRRSFGAESFDFDEPQFFSVTMDHELARINVHWLSAPTDSRQYSFHVEGLSQHLLRDANGLRAVSKAIKNILDHGADARLRTLCEALDVYREKVILEREAMTTQENQRYKARAQPQQRRRSRREQQSSYEQQQYQSPGDQQPSYGQQEYQSTRDQQPLYKQQGHESPVVQQPLYDQQGYQGPRAQQPSYEQQENESRPDLRVGESGPIYVEEDRVDGSPEYLEAEERPQRKQTTARRQARSRANTSAKARRTSSRLASKVVKYE
jgi:hypothetical protein